MCRETSSPEVANQADKPTYRRLEHYAPADWFYDEPNMKFVWEGSDDAIATPANCYVLAGTDGVFASMTLMQAASGGAAPTGDQMPIGGGDTDIQW